MSRPPAIIRIERRATHWQHQHSGLVKDNGAKCRWHVYVYTYSSRARAHRPKHWFGGDTLEQAVGELRRWRNREPPYR